MTSTRHAIPLFFFAVLLSLLPALARAQSNCATMLEENFVSGGPSAHPDEKGGFSCTDTITVPRGRQFVVVRVWATAGYYDNSHICDDGACVGGYAISVNAGGSFTDVVSVDGRSVPGASGAPWIPFESDANASEENAFHGFHREVIKVVPVGAATGEGPTSVTVVVSSGQWPKVYGILSLGYAVDGDVGIAMRQTPPEFRPRDSRDPAADCASHDADCYIHIDVSPGSGVRPVGDAPDIPFPAVTALEFTLSHARDSEKRVIGQWLKGSSTNYSRDKNDDEDSPDYVFEASKNTQIGTPSNGGLTLKSSSKWNPAEDGWGWGPVVSSRDFGGVAYLRGKVTVDGNTYDLEVFDDNDQRVKPPACVSESDFYAHPFISLPVDQDCNGIADSWEADFGGHLNRNEDKDVLGVGTCPGDGLSNFDEYRGLHYVADDFAEASSDESKIQWASTDPTVKDIFFWDASDSKSGSGPRVTDSQNRSVPIFTQALRDILEPTTSPTRYHRVDAIQANARSQTDPSLGVNKLNLYSQTANKTYAFALDFVNQPPPYQLMAWAQYFAMAGQAIYISNDLIVENWGSLPNINVVRAAVLAHETGHTLGLCHYYDKLAFVSPAPNQASELSLGQYALKTKSSPLLGTIYLTYTRQPTYLSSSAGVISKFVFDAQHFDLMGNVLLSSASGVLHTL